MEERIYSRKRSWGREVVFGEVLYGSSLLQREEKAVTHLRTVDLGLSRAQVR